ncbi:MAG: dTDP-glucose 4,6-dehydratase [Candidatus Riflebacteria bacterium]|nr:dTDP-glucose 4,6-dehydratase [Candidatus Riflebacteria bacterium]
MSSKLLITGGCGFIGSNFVRLARRVRPGQALVILDKLTYAGNLENLDGLLDDPEVSLVRGDIADRRCVAAVLDRGVDRVVNFAAESHVDRSIEDASAFIQTNVVGTQVLLEECRRAAVKRFLQVSTDEVYGSLAPPASARSDDPLTPSSPYSASKAAADLFALADHKTYGTDVVVTRATNNYGPYQFPEKMLPLMITQALEDRPLPVYGDGLQIRDWIHVEDHCEGLLLALERGRPGRIYHLGAGEEHTNLDMVHRLLAQLKKPPTLIKHVTDRPGHDRRYSLDTGSTRDELGWAPTHTLERGLAQTIEWYLSHRGWWDKIKSGEYRSYYERLYGTGGRYAATTSEVTRGSQVP